MKRSRLLASVLATGNLRYQTRVKNLFGANMTAFYPLDETSGTTAQDASGNGRNGTYTGITLANALGPSGKQVAYNNGTVGNKMVAANVPISAEGGFGGWIKLDAGEWATGVSNYWAHLFTDASNRVIITKSADNKVGVTLTRGGVTETFVRVWRPADYFHFFVTWSQANDRIRYYINSMLVETDLTIGTWAGATTSLRLFSNDGAAAMKGWEDSWCLVGGAEPTQEQINTLALMSTKRINRLSVIGDSISASALETSWVWIVTYGWRNGAAMRLLHAISGASIMTDADGDADMAAQVTEAASDNTDAIIVELGTNDTETGAALATEYQTQLLRLKASNPTVPIYCMGILPRTDMTGVAAKNAHIQTAAAAVGATYWDTSSWIDPATDLSDLVHPNIAGHAKIATEVLARLP